MDDSYTKADLKQFLEFVVTKGLVNPNTGNGWKAACGRILENLSDSDDVRNLDIKTEVRRYNNAHPGELGPSSLDQYERRLSSVLREFLLYKEGPSKYKGIGKHPTEKKRVVISKEAKLQASTSTVFMAANTTPEIVTKASGLTFSYPLRPEFLAQIIVPRDMNMNEARRLASFISTLAHDFTPTNGDGGL